MPEYREPTDAHPAVPEHRAWYRAVPTIYPTVHLWDHASNPEDLHDLAVIESYTNDRVMQELGRIDLVPEDDWIFGEGTTPIMAAFTHPSTGGSRFAPPGLGAYYAGDSPQTAAVEVAYHRQRFCEENDLLPHTFQFRLFRGEVIQPLVDIRDEGDPRPLHDPNSWEQAQRFGRQARDRREWGIHYASVRRPGGQCVALLRPPAITPVIPARLFDLEWDGGELHAPDMG